jgi:C4-dicarboxylate transporter DctM subunit
MFGGLDNFPLLAIPLFIFAGEVMGRGGLARRLVEWALSIIGGVRGSLALATIASSELSVPPWTSMATPAASPLSAA